MDVPDSRRSSHDQSIRDLYSSTQHLPDLDEIVTDGATSSEDDGNEENDAAAAAAAAATYNSGGGECGRGGLLSVAESDDMKFRRASLTLEVGQQQQQQPCSGGDVSGGEGGNEEKGKGPPQTSPAAVTATSLPATKGGTSHREAHFTKSESF